MAGISRRELMAATAAGLALAAVPGAGVAAQPPAKPRRTLRKAVMIGMIRDGATWEERFKVLKDAGFEGVEGDSPLPKEVKLGEILAAAEKAGIKIHGMVDSNHWAIPLNAPDATAQDQALDALSTCLRDAKTVGASSILLVPGIVNERLSYDECWTRSIALIRRALPLAKETGVKIAIENVWNAFIMSPLEAARYLDELNDPMVGWHFDIGNVINFGWPEQWVKVLGERILKLHIKDFSRKKRDDEGLWKGFNVQLGEGDAGWPRVMAGLDACGYSTDPAGRWATAEVSGGDSKRLLQVSEQMDRIFAL